MIYNLSNSIEREKFKIRSNFLLNNNKKVDLSIKTDTRTAQQNSALHLFFTMISDQLNEMGMDFKYEGVKGMSLSTIHTPNIIKEFIWRPIQIALYNIESTTKIDTNQMNGVIDVITKYFGDKGIVIEFPNIESLIKNN